MNQTEEEAAAATAAEPTVLFAAFDQAKQAGQNPELTEALTKVFMESAQTAMISRIVQRYAHPYAVWMYFVRMAQRPLNYLVAIALALLVLSFLPDRPIQNQPQRQQEESTNVQ